MATRNLPVTTVTPPNPGRVARRKWSGGVTLVRTRDLPPRGTPVVYFLLDGDLVIRYVGSTVDLRDRLHEHRSRRHGALHLWHAVECATRSEAYRTEESYLIENAHELAWNTQQTVGRG